MTNVLEKIESNRHLLTEQQYKTLRGQCLAGDVSGAWRGYCKLMSRRGKAGSDRKQVRRTSP